MNIANTKHEASLRSADTADIYANSYAEDGAALWLLQCIPMA